MQAMLRRLIGGTKKRHIDQTIYTECATTILPHSIRIPRYVCLHSPCVYPFYFPTFVPHVRLVRHRTCCLPIRDIGDRISVGVEDIGILLWPPTPLPPRLHPSPPPLCHLLHLHPYTPLSTATSSLLPSVFHPSSSSTPGLRRTWPSRRRVSLVSSSQGLSVVAFLPLRAVVHI
jgi:hypothetical protein